MFNEFFCHLQKWCSQKISVRPVMYEYTFRLCGSKSADYFDCCRNYYFTSFSTCKDIKLKETEKKQMKKVEVNRRVQSV